MAKIDLLFARSIGKKQLAAVSALLLAGFALFHLSANLLLLYGPEAFDEFVHGLHSLRYILIFMEIGLLATFGLHIYLGIKLALENRRARKSRYSHPNANAIARGPRGAATPGSMTMIVTGIIFAVFLLVHLYDFAITAKITGQDLYTLIEQHLSHPFWAFFYVVGVCALGVHLTHGLQSAFQTLGFFHERYTPGIKAFSVAFGIFIAAGYSVLPLYFVFR